MPIAILVRLEFLSFWKSWEKVFFLFLFVCLFVFHRRQECRKLSFPPRQWFSAHSLCGRGQINIDNFLISPLRIRDLSCWWGFHNSMKLWVIPCRATQNRWVIVKSSDKMWSTGEGNDNLLQYSWLENPIESMTRQKIWHHKMSPQDNRCPICYWGRVEGSYL